MQPWIRLIVKKVVVEEEAAAELASMSTGRSIALITVKAAWTFSVIFLQISWREFSKVCSVVAVAAIQTVPAVVDYSQL